MQPESSDAMVDILQNESSIIFTEEGISLIKGKLNQLEAKLPLSRVVLFCSYPRGSYTVASDIDLLVVYRGKIHRDPFLLVKDTLRISGLEPHIYREDEYEDNKEVVKRMEEDGIVLWDKDRRDDREGP